MSTAPNNSALKRRLDRYFWANDTGEMVFLRQVLEDMFFTFDRVAVIGGLVRDFAREGREGFRSDLDLVIDGPADSVAAFAAELGAIPNRFGGFGCKLGPWMIDFWALETTWARRHRYVHVHRLEDVVGCTFFDWDAIAYDLRARRLICSDDYLDRIRERTLDINLLPNPSPLGNLVRAVRRLVLWELRAGPSLRCFISEHLDEAALRFIQAKESELYYSAVSTRWGTAKAAQTWLLSDVRRCKGVQVELNLE
ncbi:hypothetical protein EGK70_010215 [Alcaligenes aquatilis]|uniref:hypothetical protein n=1 Tax=Alcaligenes aquatilis TaxID=323284 RepID=UPI000F6801A0|nr:hypothetical protein [Alcaligenes aquatilis]QXR34272.1 hypothetical protein EGK70_010215 [Alcaligenes aquatilis]